MDKKTGNRIALNVSTEERNGFFHIRARAYVITPDGKIDSPQYDTETIGGLFLKGLTVSCQGHSASAWPSGNTSSDHGRLYAFEHGYTVSCDVVTSRDAGKIAKALATIDRRLDKLYQQRGSAESFAEYFIRIADVIGADEILERRKDADSYPWGSADAYRRMSLSDGRYHVTRLAREWSERVRPTERAEAS